jgi:aconitate hydratase
MMTRLEVSRCKLMNNILSV